MCMCRPTGYEIGSTQKYICCFIRVTHAIKLCVLETEEFFELITGRTMTNWRIFKLDLLEKQHNACGTLEKRAHPACNYYWSCLRVASEVKARLINSEEPSYEDDADSPMKPCSLFIKIYAASWYSPSQDQPTPPRKLLDEIHCWTL